MIVRILTVGQFEVADDQAQRLNELDNAVVEAVSAGDQALFRQRFDAMIDLIHDRGRELDGEELSESEVFVPPPDTTLEEAAREFTGEGLIPG